MLTDKGWHWTRAFLALSNHRFWPTDSTRCSVNQRAAPLRSATVSEIFWCFDSFDEVTRPVEQTTPVAGISCHCYEWLIRHLAHDTEFRVSNPSYYDAILTFLAWHGCFTEMRGCCCINKGGCVIGTLYEYIGSPVFVTRATSTTCRVTESWGN